jgi:membrane carboxypeptidase/penicillin-binding protein
MAKRLKKTGIIYFAINTRIPNMVKVGKTTESAESRLKTANRKHEFMCGRWSINQKVATNNVARTEELSHMIFSRYHDKESVSTEMFFIPEDMTVKQMADTVREKDQILVKQQSKQAKAEEAVKKAQEVLENLNNQTAAMIMPENEIAGDEDNLS